MSDNISIDRFSIATEDGDVAIVNTDDGEWVQFEEMDKICRMMYEDIQKMRTEIQNCHNVINTMKQHTQTPEYTVCPRCGYPQEETNIKNKECPSCEFEWVSTTGY
jgi:predicted Zn-ribbon and HTH transcriptional regulator